ncbi:MAG: DUF4071 domain-containing protein [Verrucomicrobia bacterium]|nr:DUF4071 domain-containing protein [Verrucomicrobiota bacterium]
MPLWLRGSNSSQLSKQRLAEARKQGKEAVRQTGRAVRTRGVEDVGVIIDLLLSYRAVECWPEMIDLAKGLAGPLASTAMVQEQLALALNREGKTEEAVKVLDNLVRRHGITSETSGILGRVYKDAAERYRPIDEKKASVYLEKAIESYLRGFEFDAKDAYPGINAVTLMELRDQPNRPKDLIPRISEALERQIASGKADYWDYATQLEIAVLLGEEKTAKSALQMAVATDRETWEPKSTANNLNLIRNARLRRELRSAQEAANAAGAAAGRQQVQTGAGQRAAARSAQRAEQTARRDAEQAAKQKADWVEKIEKDLLAHAEFLSS